MRPGTFKVAGGVEKSWPPAAEAVFSQKFLKKLNKLHYSFHGMAAKGAHCGAGFR